MLTERMVVDGLIADPNDPIFDRLEAVLTKLDKQGLTLAFVGHEEVDMHLKWSWVDASTGTAVHMWDDYRSDVKYLELRVPDEATMTLLRSLLSAKLKPPTRASLLARARRKLERTPLMRVVFAAGNEPDDDTVALVTGALADSSPHVRGAAAYGAGVLGWPVFRAPLEQALTSEQDGRVLDALRRSLAIVPAAS